MNHEGTIEDFETQIEVLQAKIDALKERKEVWTPKDGPWRLTLNLEPYLRAAQAPTGVGASYATRDDALAAVPLRRRQQLLEAYKREFDPAFKPKFDGSQANYYPIYLPARNDDDDEGIWIVTYDRARRDPQRTYFSCKGVTDLVEKLNNGTVVLELGTMGE
ncbi:MAG: hypothetical protein GY814_01760 [Gammaproteobacteria bacterium]|nr:hypothetical protein [Gammaproteobacteria bacterium]